MVSSMITDLQQVWPGEWVRDKNDRHFLQANPEVTVQVFRTFPEQGREWIASVNIKTTVMQWYASTREPSSSPISALQTLRGHVDRQSGMNAWVRLAIFGNG